MTRRLHISYDSDLLEQISSDFDLRKPNKEALRKLIFTLDGDYDPEVMQVLNLATGVGKTYLMAAFVEYLRCQGVKNIMIVTPGKTVQSKTVQNFTPGSNKYITGSPVPPDIVTPQNYSEWIARVNGGSLFSIGQETPVLTFIFNIQQLIAPSSEDGDTHGTTQDAIRRKPRKFDENAGVLFDYLKELDDLVVIADESHLYSTSAEAFNSALKELEPAAAIGLTASVLPEDHVIFKYPLYQAIQDRYIKAPVLAFRKDGYDETQESEEQQLKDALQLREYKQHFYDAYSEQHGREKLNAVVFVVCQDVDHATQVTELLRSPRFFNNELAVLQVDSKHDDDITNRMLDNLDGYDSPVLAVVSVNKLKEGWDVKNIAVIVTLRAMASEVLTQQTMGRGLRLPFGKYTDILQIDQLDIISHQSFRELLSAENVLQQFGLEEAVTEKQKEQLDGVIKNITKDNYSPAVDDNQPTVSSPITSSTLADSEAVIPEINYPEEEDTPRVTIREVGKQQSLDDFEVEKPKVVTVNRNPKFSDITYNFPTTKIIEEQAEISLAKIDKRDIERAAKRVTSTGDIMVRKEIIFALGKGVKAIDTESATVDSISINFDDAELALTRLVMNMQIIPVTTENSRLAKNYLVNTFMKEVDFEEWTVKSLASAEIELNNLVRNYANEILRNKQEKTEIIPVTMPRDEKLHVPFGQIIHEQIDSREEFVRGRFYKGWFKSFFESEAFDSYSGEYLLAKLLNTSPNIAWWHRLQRRDNAYIYFNAKDRYFPDFVAQDNEGRLWIIEGKSEAGRDDDVVQAKRRAAEEVVVRLIAHDDFEGQKWGYLIAYENDVQASDTWDDLKTKAQPITN